MTIVVFDHNNMPVFHDKAPATYCGRVMCLIGPTKNKWYSWFNNRWYQLEQVHPRYRKQVDAICMIEELGQREVAPVEYKMPF